MSGRDWVGVLLGYCLGIMTGLALGLSVQAHSQELPPPHVHHEHAPAVFDKAFAATLIVQAGSVVFDAETTRRNLATGNFHEGNVLYGLTPSTPRLYGQMFAQSAAMAFLGYELKKHGSRWWLLPHLFEIGTHVQAGFHNVAIGGNR